MGKTIGRLLRVGKSRDRALVDFRNFKQTLRRINLQKTREIKGKTELELGGYYVKEFVLICQRVKPDRDLKHND